MVATIYLSLFQNVNPYRVFSCVVVFLFLPWRQWDDGGQVRTAMIALPVVSSRRFMNILAPLFILQDPIYIYRIYIYFLFPHFVFSS